jgi:uncharacterized protein (TIGR02996 family)
MNAEQTLLAALHEDPTDTACWLALADALEESSQSDRAELLRLRLKLQTAGRRTASSPARRSEERQMRALLEAGVRPPVPIRTNSIGQQLALISAGSFWMGSPPGEQGRHRDEDPWHRVTISRPFYLGVYPVTQAEYQAVMGHNPSYFCAGGEGAGQVDKLDTSRFPVEQISWQDAMHFCNNLSTRLAEQKAGCVYRLPTEAEWEFACRAGTTSMFSFGDELTSDRANINGHGPVGAPTGAYLERTCEVGSYPPNAFGLYDMHGNVWEWCLDWFGERYYAKSPAIDPPGARTSRRKVLRGGSWRYGALICRSAYRYRYAPEVRINDYGMRLALDVS